jgi:hypothetical protein
MLAIANDPIHWTIADGPDYDYFVLDVEEKMPGKCGPEPWPGIDSWPSDPNRS